MKDNNAAIKERLSEILESISLIQDWSRSVTCPQDFLTSPHAVMVFNACVMRLQVIGEDVGKLLKSNASLLQPYNHIPWHAIYGMRNIISHEYANIDEEVIYQVIRDELPKLKATVDELLSTLI